MGPMKGKDFDTGNVLGPWIVTRDEIGDPHTLAMEVRVNGERWGGGNSGRCITFNKIIAFISRSETLYPGEVIASGTVPTGCGLELGAPSRTTTWSNLRSRGWYSAQRVSTLISRPAAPLQQGRALVQAVATLLCLKAPRSPLVSPGFVSASHAVRFDV